MLTSDLDKDDYRAWLAVGPGGRVQSIRGYWQNVYLAALYAGNDTQGLQMYDNPKKYEVGWGTLSDAEKEKAFRTFLQGPLPQRPGPRVKALHFNVPQREKNVADAMDPKLEKVS